MDISLKTGARSLAGFSFPRVWQALREYFRYHGVMTPGVRMMRSVNVLTKVIIISSAFAIPLALTGWHFLRNTQESLTAATLERRGMRYTEALVDLTQSLQAARQAIARGRQAGHSPDLAPLIAEMDRRYEVLNGLEQSTHDVLHTREAFAELSRQHAIILHLPSDPIQQEQAWNAYLNALQRLRAVGRDVLASSIELDGHDFILAQLALVNLPELSDQLFELSLNGSSLLNPSNSLSGDTAHLFTVLGIAQSRWDSTVVSLEHLKRTRPELMAQVSSHDALTQMPIYFTRSGESLISGLAQGDQSLWIQQGIETIDILWKLQRACTQALEQDLDARERNLSSQRQAVLASVVLCMGIVIYLLVAMHNVMHGGLSALRAQVDRLARGDLSTPPMARGRDEVADALMSLRESLMRLSDLFTAVRQHVRGVAHASSKIALGNEDLASRTERSAQSIEQIEQSLAAFGQKLDECGRLLNDTVPRLQSMRSHSIRSKKSMGKLRDRMGALQIKSVEIREIVDLIEGIAAQTNILSLNASVEAARVGEAGKGFAVVASEVRALAQRSAAAADQINSIVMSSIEEIEQSSGLADRVATSVQATDECANLVDASMVDLVDLMSQGQQHARDVLNAVTEVRSSTESNAQLVEQLSNAAGVLSEQGAALNDEVAVFKS